MADTAQYMIALPADIAAVVEAAISTGQYSSPSALVVDALQHWHAMRPSPVEAFELLKADIATGTADMASGRTREFDVVGIAERGKALSPVRSHSG